MVRRDKNLSCPLSSNLGGPSGDTNEVLGKYKILPGAYIIIISTSAHTITSFWVFVINIIKMNVDWKNCHHY